MQATFEAEHAGWASSVAAFASIVTADQVFSRCNADTLHGTAARAKQGWGGLPGVAFNLSVG